MLYDIHYWDKDSCFWLFITFWLLYSSINHLHRPHVYHRYHRLHPWRKICHVEKFQISVKNFDNLWSFIEIYAVFVLNLCGENLCRKMTNMRSDQVPHH